MFVCTACAPERRGLLAEMRAELPDVEIEGIECMSGCTRAQTVAFRETGKVAYLFGEITAADFADLRHFVTLYRASADGTFPDARVLGQLRHKAIARIPA